MTNKKNRRGFGRHVVLRLQGKELIDSVSNNRGIINRDVGYELLMGIKSREVVYTSRVSNNYEQILADPRR